MPCAEQAIFYTIMKNFKNIISILTTALAISAVATPALCAALNQAVIRSVYDEDATQPIAKSLVPRVTTNAGDRFAVVQYSGGDWALALVPRGVDVRRQQVVELAPVETRTFDSGKMAVVMMLTRERSIKLITRADYAN
jgi:hypothetical protein